ADNIIKAAELATKEDIFQKRDALEKEAEQKRNELREQERRLEKREDSLEQKHQSLVKKERSLDNTHRKLSERRAEVEKRMQDVEEVHQKQLAELHRISELSREQAQTLLLERLQRELSEEIGHRLRKHEENLKAVAEDKARQVLATCIHRYAAEHTADTTVS